MPTLGMRPTSPVNKAARNPSGPGHRHGVWRALTRALSIALLPMASACGGEAGSQDAGALDGAAEDAARDGSMVDAHVGHGDAGLDIDAAVADVVVRITSPTSPQYVSTGTVAVQVFVEGGDPERVDLLVNENPLAMLAVPYRYDLIVDDLPEGTHQVVARARVNGTQYLSAPLVLVVDRMPPRVVAQRPAADEPYTAGQPLELEFSEPMDPTSITASSVRVVNGAGDAFVVDLTLQDGDTVLSITLLDGPPSAAGSLLVNLSGDITDARRRALEPTELLWVAPVWVVDPMPVLPTSVSTLLPVARATTAGLVVAARAADGRLRVLRRIDDGWEEMPATGCEGLASSHSWTLSVDATGAPLLVTSFGSSPSFGYRFCRWDGSAWTSLLPDLTGIASGPTNLTIAPGASAGAGVVAYRQSVSSSAISRFRVGGWSPSALAMGGPFGLLQESDGLLLADTFTVSDGAECRLSRYPESSLVRTEERTLRVDTDRTVEGLAPSTFRCGCTVARRTASSTWSAVTVPVGDDYQRCAGATTASGAVILVSRMAEAPFTLGAFLETPEGTLVSLGTEVVSFLQPRGGPTEQTIAAAVHPSQGLVLVAYGNPPGRELGLYTIRLNTLPWGLP